MKRTYTGLYTCRMVVENQPLLQNSTQKIKAKTKSSNWKEENITVEEFGVTGISVSDISSPLP